MGSPLQKAIGLFLAPYRSYQYESRLHPDAKAERKRDRRGLAAEDPGIDRAVEEAVAWLSRAQDDSASHDGGVARHYDLTRGWATSYPETTGYIIPTLIDYAKLSGRSEPRERAKRMLDWLVSIQFSEGGFQAGTMGSTPVVPVTFNTGQILMGLASGTLEFGTYRDPMLRAADWLVATQDPDGCWRKHMTPKAAPGEKVYETHVSWGLLEAARVEPNRGYGEAALRQVRWALTHQRPNGWFAHCCLNDPSQPLTHTLGYALRGVVEAYRWSEDRSFLEAARRTADGLLSALRPDGFLPGRLRSDWSAAVSWVCLTGSVQIAHSWMLLFEATGERKYLEAARAANAYVRRTLRIDVPPGARGGVKGSFPVEGGYGTYQYLNWAAKFAIDSYLLEKRLT